MAQTQQDIALQMVAQLQALDPSISAEVGTPERKIIDTVAQSLAEAQIDLTVFQGAFDVDSKIGSDLERFLGLFGFARQRAAFATGVVQFSRTSAATSDIRIPTGTQVAAGVDPTNFGNRVTFSTTNDAVIPVGQTTVTAPVRAAIGGARGNVAANTITAFVGSPVLGVTTVTNPAVTTGGQDEESDDEFKVRFKNTVFRNLAGTVDQYLALALATTFTTKANVVGPLSRYLEYMQVPAFDDATAYDINGDNIVEAGNGSSNQWTTALSTIPYSKHIYDTLPVFASTGDLGTSQVFYTEDLDFTFNTLPADKNKGDAYRLALVSEGPDPLASPLQPNLTFLTVDPVNDEISVPSPGQVVLFEHSYMSDASRNDYDRNVLNCVDVFIDGGDDTPASVVVPLPTTAFQFNTVTTNRFYFNNFRRLGEPDHRPVIGNVVTPLMFQPVSGLPDHFVLGNTTYYEGIHYWAVEDVSKDIKGTVRARNGIEWDHTLPGQASGDPATGPYTGPTILTLAGTVATMEVDYLYDRSVGDLQVALEGARQTTTDVLAHKATERYFKLNLTVMYTPGFSIAGVNEDVASALTSFFAGQYFGTTIQLSDLLQVVHDTAGVDNVRWSRDIEPNLDCVVETDINGKPRATVVIDRRQHGVAGVTSEIQQMYITGNPTGTYTLTLNTSTTAPLSVSANAATVQSQINAALGGSPTVTGSGTPTDPFVITWPTVSSPQNLLTATTAFQGGDFAFDSDFFLKDNELPGLPDGALSTDTTAGLVIRPRAQNTWSRGG